MTIVQKLFLVLFFAACSSETAAIQMSRPPIVSALPDVSSISAENAAGVLEYCVTHQLVSGVVAETVLTRLMAKRGVGSSALFAAGKSGRIMTANKEFPLTGASKFLRSEACDRVLKQAQRLK